MTSQLSLMPTTNEMAIFQTVSKHAAQSKFYSKFGGEGAILMILLAAREMNISPMQALNGGINIIQGKVEIAPRMMSALIRRAGHRLTVKECTDEQCTLIGFRTDTKETQELSFSLQDAKKAGIYKSGGPWEKYPKDMCYARAMSRLARQLFSDVIGIGYVEGEISQEPLNDIAGLAEAEATFQDDTIPVQVEPDAISVQEAAPAPIPEDPAKRDAIMKELNNIIFGFSKEESERFCKGLDKNFIVLDTATLANLEFALAGARSIKGIKV